MPIPEIKKNSFASRNNSVIIKACFIVTQDQMLFVTYSSRGTIIAHNFINSNYISGIT